MRQDQTLVYPAQYGGMAAYRRTHLAGVAHPMAGQPSIELLVAAYTSDYPAAGIPKTPPASLVNAVANNESFFNEMDAKPAFKGYMTVSLKSFLGNPSHMKLIFVR